MIGGAAAAVAAGAVAGRAAARLHSSYGSAARSKSQSDVSFASGTQPRPAGGTGGTIALEQLALLKDDNMLIDAALRGTLVVPAFDAFCAALVEIFAETYPNKGGAYAGVFPLLYGTCFGFRQLQITFDAALEAA